MQLLSIASETWTHTYRRGSLADVFYWLQIFHRRSNCLVVENLKPRCLWGHMVACFLLSLPTGAFRLKCFLFFFSLTSNSLPTHQSTKTEPFWERANGSKSAVLKRKTFSPVPSTVQPRHLEQRTGLLVFLPPRVTPREEGRCDFIVRH